MLKCKDNSLRGRRAEGGGSYIRELTAAQLRENIRKLKKEN